MAILKSAAMARTGNESRRLVTVRIMRLEGEGAKRLVAHHNGIGVYVVLRSGYGIFQVIAALVLHNPRPFAVGRFLFVRMIFPATFPAQIRRIAVVEGHGLALGQHGFPVHFTTVNRQMIAASPISINAPVVVLKKRRVVVLGAVADLFPRIGQGITAAINRAKVSPPRGREIDIPIDHRHVGRVIFHGQGRRFDKDPVHQIGGVPIAAGFGRKEPIFIFIINHRWIRRLPTGHLGPVLDLKTIVQIYRVTYVHE